MGIFPASCDVKHIANMRGDFDSRRINRTLLLVRIEFKCYDVMSAMCKSLILYPIYLCLFSAGAQKMTRNRRQFGPASSLFVVALLFAALRRTLGDCQLGTYTAYTAGNRSVLRALFHMLACSVVTS